MELADDGVTEEADSYPLNPVQEAAGELLAALKELMRTAQLVAFDDAPPSADMDEYQVARDKARAAIKATEGR